jgi:hypothetical protein
LKRLKTFRTFLLSELPDFSGDNIMTASDDFKAQLKAGNITEALALALSEAVELKFTTWVPSDDDVEEAQSRPGHRLCTRINTIAGEIEHEIGEEFIGTGRYRELKQFHLEQVAQGSKLVQNNLKSLQKLFEVLVALHYPEREPTAIEPQSLDIDSPVLPALEEVPDAGLVVEPPEAVVADSLVSPGTLTGAEIPVAGLVAEAPEAIVADSPTSPDTLTGTDVVPDPFPPSEQAASFVTIPTQSDRILEEELEEEADEEDEDWDSSVLDLLESIPVVPPPGTETPESDLREDLGWGDLADEEAASDREESDLPENQEWATLRREDFAAPTDSDEPHSELSNAEVVHDLRNLVEGEPTPAQTDPDSPENQDWVTLNPEDFAAPAVSDEPPHIPSTSEIDEDWGDLIEEEQESELEKPIPSLDSLDIEEDEEWDDWVMEESEPALDTPVVDMDSLELSEDEDWGDFVEDTDPFAPTSGSDDSLPDLQFDEDWDDFTAAALGSSSSVSAPGTGLKESFDLSESQATREGETLQADDSALPRQSKPEVSAEHSDTVAGNQEESDTQRKFTDKRMPPPPPPSHHPRPE